MRVVAGANDSYQIFVLKMQQLVSVEVKHLVYDRLHFL